MEEERFYFEFQGLGEQFYGYLKIVGKLTHKDYEQFVPMFEEELQCVKEPKVKMLVDITELDGFELKAMWDDLKFGLKHNFEFTQIAVVGNSTFYEYGIKIANWFTHAQMEYFEEETKAKKWLGII